MTTIRRFGRSRATHAAIAPQSTHCNAFAKTSTRSPSIFGRIRHSSTFKGVARTMSKTTVVCSVSHALGPGGPGRGSSSTNGGTYGSRTNVGLRGMMIETVLKRRHPSRENCHHSDRSSAVLNVSKK